MNEPVRCACGASWTPMREWAAGVYPRSQHQRERWLAFAWGEWAERHRPHGLSK